MGYNKDENCIGFIYISMFLQEHPVDLFHKKAQKFFKLQYWNEMFFSIITVSWKKQCNQLVVLADYFAHNTIEKYKS